VYNVFSDTFAQGVGADIGADALGRLMVSMPIAYLGTITVYFFIHTYIQYIHSSFIRAGLSLLYWKITCKVQPAIDAPIRLIRYKC
jgi:hypothetical protein